MITTLFTFVLLFVMINARSPELTVTVTDKGEFSVQVGGVEWLASAYTKVYSYGSWVSNEDNSLALVNQSIISGNDILGSYTSNVFSWVAKMKNSAVLFETSIKTYDSLPNAIFFGQLFPEGLSNTSIGSQDVPVTVFPSFNVAQKLGFLHYYSDMAGYEFQTGVFPTNYAGGYKGGPLVLFNANLTSLVMSPLSNFLSTITNINATDNVLMVGVQGKVQQIPAGYGFEYVISLDQGVHNAMMSWGDIMLSRYGKTRLPPTVSTVISYLGYSTTAYYFYNPLDGNASYGNYEETMLAFNSYSKQLGIPYRYYLLDSWWYGEYDVYGGVWMWEDNRELLKQRFPHGLEWLRDALGVPFVCHMGKWVSDSPYIKNETYGFVVEESWALPTAVEFWDYIFGNASGWGLNTIKQDHINEQLLDMEATLSDVTTARTWLLNQGKGAWHHGINIEYCMDYTSVLLTSLENPTATHSRAGDDYLPKEANYQWRIGVTSMFLWAIGLYPDKDTFYTTTTEVVTNPKAPYYKFQEPYPVTHAIASCLSAGPITPSDGIKGTDKALVMRMCAADGLLLKPDRPAVNIDSTWIQRSFGGSIGPKGDVIATYTQIGPFTWHFVFAAQLNESYSFLSTDLLLPFEGEYMAYLLVNDGVTKLTAFSASKGFLLPSGLTYGDAYYLILNPVLDNGWVFLGETDKYITISKQRFKSIATSPNQVQIEIAGTPGESVRLSFIAPSSTQIQQFQCVVSQSGFSVFTIPGATCVAN